ncbi:glycosyl hydrolase family 18 protein [Peptococcaceae bacterium 1198_IL3148]
MRKLKSLTLVLCVLLALLLPATVWAAPGDNLQLGDHGDDVKFLQQKLQQAGFYPAGELSGHFGLNTLLAVNEFEAEHKLNDDGIVTKEDWLVLAPEVYNTGGQAKHSDKVVLTYVQGNIGMHSLEENSQSIDYSAQFNAFVAPDGRVKFEYGVYPKDGMKIAKDNNIKPLLVVHNMANYPDNGYVSVTSKEVIHQVLNSPAKRQRAIKDTLQLVEKYGFAGVNIDFEAMPPSDRNQFTLFLTEMRQTMASRGYLVTAALQAKTEDNPSGYFGAFDYAKIGSVLDYAVVMTYDYNGPWGQAGPVAALPWVNDVLKYATSVMPSQKILMGVPAYGYRWSMANQKVVDTGVIQWQKAKELTKYGPIKWDNQSSSPYIKYNSSNLYHEAWFENKYSLEIKLQLINQYKLGGIALWKLGFEDDSFWKTVNDHL